ncbi:outer membrane lipoprotein-sorting protein [Saccharospirillum alexandrii]|uniref:outer membrane lipoprotein-sorting protein n=1 Tax=Saccharospirillum alexandrii TaxID=2448477 RepID=UPI003736DD64
MRLFTQVPPNLTAGIAILMAMLVLACNTAQAETGREIMEQVDAQPSPELMAADMAMTLIDRNGNQRVRRLRSLSQTFDDSERSLLFFLEPADVRGTGFLVHDYDDPQRSDDQWLFLPSMNKSKRIAGSDQSSSFMGSDLSYADMSSRNLDEWTYELLGEERVGEEPVWRVRATAANQSVVDRTGYTESVVYVQQSNHQVIRAIHTLEHANERKLMNLPEWEQRDGFWLPLVMQVVSQEGGQTVHRTQLTFSNINLNPEVSASEFTVQRLEQGL